MNYVIQFDSSAVSLIANESELSWMFCSRMANDWEIDFFVGDFDGQYVREPADRSSFPRS